GVLTEYPVLSGGNPSEMTAGPDGALWFTEYYGVRIVRITTLGALTVYPQQPSGTPIGITAGPDGHIWFAIGFTDRIGQIIIPTAVMTANPSTGVPGESITVNGSGFSPSESVAIYGNSTGTKLIGT